MAQEAVAPEGAGASAEDEDEEAEGVEPAGWGRCAAAHDEHTHTTLGPVEH